MLSCMMNSHPRWTRQPLEALGDQQSSSHGHIPFPLPWEQISDSLMSGMVQIFIGIVGNREWSHLTRERKVERLGSEPRCLPSAQSSLLGVDSPTLLILPLLQVLVSLVLALCNTHTAPVEAPKGTGVVFQGGGDHLEGWPDHLSHPHIELHPSLLFCMLPSSQTSRASTTPIATRAEHIRCTSIVTVVGCSICPRQQL